MRKPGWYVIQVETGKEQRACEFIRYAYELADEVGLEGESILQECFCPTYQHKRKVRGQWVELETLLLPGYVIAVTHDPWKLSHTLRAVPDFTKLLTMGETFIPLSTDDKQWIERWTTQGNRSIPMSFGYKEGDKVVVTEGPLVGHEAMITRVNRRKRVAHLEIHAGQLTIHTTVGLEVLPGNDK